MSRPDRGLAERRDSRRRSLDAANLVMASGEFSPTSITRSATAGH
jgi:hypothetical protein